MKCSLELGKRAKRFLEKEAPKDVVNSIKERLEYLAENPKCDERLKGILKDLCKTRVGSYRIVYQLKPCIIVVIAIDHRDKFYDKLKHMLK